MSRTHIGLRWWPHWAAALLAALSVSPAAAREGGKEEPKEPPVVWPEKAVPGQSVTLRLKRAPGKCLIYDGSLERSQQSEASYTEDAQFYLTVLCVEQDGGLDQLAFRRTYLNRNRREVLENGRKIDRILENTDDLVNLGPNCNIIDKLRCYAYDAQNRMAYRVEQPLICINDTPHFLFPLLPQRAVAPGDTWKFKVPLIIPVEQVGPVPALPTQFSAAVIGRLREVRQGGGTQVAVVDYQVSGVFDSGAAEFRARFAEAFHETDHIIHKVSGSGTVTLDVDKGRILEKAENISVTIFGSSLIQQPAGKPAVQKEKRAEIVSKYQIKLLPPGTRLKNGKAIPDYDGKDER